MVSIMVVSNVDNGEPAAISRVSDFAIRGLGEASCSITMIMPGFYLRIGLLVDWDEEQEPRDKRPGRGDTEYVVGAGVDEIPSEQGPHCRLQ